MRQLREGRRGADKRRGPGGPAVAALLAGLLVAAVALPYDGRVFAFYYTPRVAVFYPLVLLFALAALWAGRRAGRPSFDLLDLALAAFVAWQLVAAALAPVWTLAWFGAYNRFGGAVYLIALTLVLALARRVLVSRAALEVFAWTTACVVALAATVALLQAVGAGTPWRFEDAWVGRMAGTTGNPLNLAGLCLIGVWLGVIAAGLPPLSTPARWAAGLAAALALAGLVVSVSRAAYLGVAAALVLLGLVALMRRPRALALLAGVVAVLAVGAVLYDPGGTGSGALSGRVALNLEASTYGLRADGLSRGTFWRIAVQAIDERPLTGWGPGGYVVAYRRYVPAETLQPSPLSSVTDPHSLPLLLAAGSGVPGLALAVAIAAIVVVYAAPPLWRLLRRRVRRGGDRRGGALRGGDPEGGGEDEDTFSEGRVLAASAGALALACFLALSPADPSAAVPFVLMLAMMAAAPAAVTPAAASGGWRLARRLALAATAGAFIAVALLVTQLYGADAALKRAVTGDDHTEAVRAAEALPWMPAYGLVAGAMTVRAAAAGMQQPLFEQGERLLRTSLAADPSAPAARIELARYHLSFMRIDEAMEEVRTGLEWSPDNPVLQGLWGYAAQSAAASGSKALAEELARGLRAYPGKGADGWYWLSVALAALGEESEARRALAEAQRRAPGLDRSAYEARLRGVL